MLWSRDGWERSWSQGWLNAAEKFPFLGRKGAVHKLHSCVVLYFFPAFCSFFAFIWRFQEEPVDLAIPSSFFQLSIKCGFTLFQGFLLVEAKWSQLRLLELRPLVIFCILFSAEQLYLPETFFFHLFSCGLGSLKEKEGTWISFDAFSD